MTDANGRSAAGTIAVLAWPSQDANRKLSVGSAVVTPTIGWASAASDGTFSVRIDPTLLPADYINPDGRVNLEAVGWTAASQGRWSFSSEVDPVAGATKSVAPIDPAVITIAATDPLRTVTGTSKAAVQPAFVSCAWFLQSTYDAMVIVGYSWPYGTDTGWMKSSSSHTEKVGVAASTTGVVWSVNGTSSTTSGVTFTWPESIAYRDFRDEHRYGKYRYNCDGVYQASWTARELYGTGGYGNASVTNPGFTFSCPSVVAGVWSRNNSTGNHLALSTGVKTSTYLGGLNLSVDTNWDTAHTLSYRLVANGKVCGDNASPSLASRVRTTR